MADLRRLAQRAVAKLYHDSFIHGRLGRLNSDGSYTIRVPDRPAYAYVQMASEGGQTIAIARNPGVSLQANLPVRMRDHNGDLVIEGVDFDKLAMVESSDPSGPPAAGVQVHHHRIGSGLEYEYDPRLFEAGRVYHASGMAVYINPFRYQKADGTFEYWEGGTLSLASHQPGTSGEHAWVLIGIDPSDNTATAAAGTAKADTSELTIAELDDISFAGKIPCGAVRVREDDGDLSDLSKYVDAHGWHNQVLNQLRSLTGNLGVYVADNGDVAVKHESPSSPLDVSGEMRTDTRLLSPAVRAASAAGLRLEDDAGNLGLEIADGGNVSVGDSIASGDTSRALNLIATNAVARVWRFTDNTGLAPAVELIWGDESGPTDDGNFFWDMFVSGADGSFSIRDRSFGQGNARRLTIDDNGNTGFGTSSPQGRIHADQSSTTGAIPVLLLDQADLSEEMIRFDTTVGTGNPVDTGSIGTLVAKVRVSVNGTHRYIPLYDS